MKQTILAVDDALTMRKLVAFTLRSAGYDVLEAPNGVEALRLLAGCPVHLVISDVNMPEMDGIELTRQVRQKLRGQPLPILILTTETDGEKKQAARAAGATGWLVKPFQAEQLLAVVGKVLGGTNRALSAA